MILAEAFLASALAQPKGELLDQAMALNPEPKVVQVEAVDRVLDRLSGDWNFIEAFLNDPHTALGSYELPRDAYRAMVTRDVDGLLQLGIDGTSAIVALSGAHSQTCSGPRTRTGV